MAEKKIPRDRGKENWLFNDINTPSLYWVSAGNDNVLCVFCSLKIIFIGRIDFHKSHTENLCCCLPFRGVEINSSIFCYELFVIIPFNNYFNVYNLAIIVQSYNGLKILLKNHCSGTIIASDGSNVLFNFYRASVYSWQKFNNGSIKTKTNLNWLQWITLFIGWWGNCMVYITFSLIYF